MNDIFKFGGSILKTKEDIKICAEMTLKVSEKSLPIIVVSAFQNVTDELFDMINFFTPNQDKSDFNTDFCISTGEQITAALLAIEINQNGGKAEAMAGWQVPIKTTSKRASAEIIEIEQKKILQMLSSGIIPIITGFQGVDSDNRITTLGRGGSDLTAITLAQKFKRNCILFKQSGGICAADPNLIENPLIWKEASYEDIINLAKAGCKVVQEAAAIIARAYDIPITICNLEQTSKTLIRNWSPKFWSLYSQNEGSKSKLGLVSKGARNKINEFKDYFFEPENEDLIIQRFEKNEILKHAKNIYMICEKIL